MGMGLAGTVVDGLKDLAVDHLKEIDLSDFRPDGRRALSVLIVEPDKPQRGPSALETGNFRPHLEETVFLRETRPRRQLPAVIAVVPGCPVQPERRVGNPVRQPVGGDRQDGLGNRERVQPERGTGRALKTGIRIERLLVVEGAQPDVVARIVRQVKPVVVMRPAALRRIEPVKIVEEAARQHHVTRGRGGRRHHLGTVIGRRRRKRERLRRLGERHRVPRNIRKRPPGHAEAENGDDNRDPHCLAHLATMKAS